MVAAIVTYLVILIQFMFAEKSSNESKISVEHLITTTLKSVINQTTMENLPTDSYTDIEWSTAFTQIEEHATSSAIVENVSIY